MIDFTFGHVVILNHVANLINLIIIRRLGQRLNSSERDNFLRILKLFLNILQWVFRNDLTVVIFTLFFFN